MRGLAAIGSCIVIDGVQIDRHITEGSDRGPLPSERPVFATKGLLLLLICH